MRLALRRLPSSDHASWRTALWVPMAAGLFLTAASCTSGEGQAREWPPSLPEVEVTLDEYTFGLERQVPAGRVEFRFRNIGDEAHHAMLVPLPEDLPPIGEQLAGDERRDVDVLAAINPHQPGEEGTFAVDLQRGRRYGLVCFVEDDDGTLHAHHGMHTEFRAGGPDAEPPDDEPADSPSASPSS